MYYNTLGVVFLLYGVLKLLLIVSIMTIPPYIQEKLHKIEWFSLFVSKDKTVAGKMYEYVLLVFAVFSIIHGLALLGVFSEGFREAIESKNFQYPFYIILGLWLLVFYILVIYTDLPIQKEPLNTYNYKIYGYLGGLSFLLVPPIWIMIEYFNPFLTKMREEQQLMYMTLIMFLALFMIFLTYVVNKRLRRMINEGRMKQEKAESDSSQKK